MNATLELVTSRESLKLEGVLTVFCVAPPGGRKPDLSHDGWMDGES